MDSDEVSLRIRPTAEAGEPEELYDEAWDYVVETIRKNAKHPSSREVLDEYLAESKGDGEGSSDTKAIVFVFLSPSSACDVQMAVATHWFELAIALAKDELAALAERHGFTAKAPARSAKDLANAKRPVPFVPSGKTLVGVRPRKMPIVLTDGGGEDPLDEAELSTAAKKAVLEVAKSRLCACAFCATIRAGKAVVPKLKKPRPKPKEEPATPAPADGAPVALQHYTSIEKAIRHADRCGSVADAPMRSITIPPEIAKLVHVKELRLGHLANLPPELFSLKTLESLSFTYGVISYPPAECELPAAIGQLVNLKSLRLPQTLTKLPATLGDLVNLERLDLSSSIATEIPETLTRLSRLRWLSLKGASRLEKPLPALGELGELEFLDLSSILKSSKGLFDRVDFSRLKNLKELCLNGNKALPFPETLRDLPGLERLRIGWETFRDPPAHFGTLTGLIELDARRSASEHWPKALNDLPSLREINLERSEIADMDAFASLPALVKLDLSESPLVRLPARAPNLPALKSLRLDSTHLAHLPDWVGELPALEELNLERTPLPPGEVEALRQRRPTLKVFFTSSAVES